MAYMIKTYTFQTPVPANSSYPFYGAGPTISVAGAREEIIYFDDNDGYFEQVASHLEPAQALLKDTTLGGVVLTEGTVLTYRNSKVSVISNELQTKVYYVIFPYTAGSSAYSMTEIGDRTTVMIIPSDINTPEFDPTQDYIFLGASTPSSMRMTPTTIPPGYLTGMCFAAGSLIETAQGPRPVETLSTGDLILTRDHGLRPLSWIGQRRVSARHLDIAPNLRPITIRAGALGAGLPATDLTVSPQHRVLVKSRISERLAGQDETLIAAKHLIGMPGIAVSPAPEGIHYIHLLFDRHELVLSNGCWTESLFPGPRALMTLGQAGRREIQTLFPELFAPNAPPPEGARIFLAGQDARELTRRHLKNAKPLYC